MQELLNAQRAFFLQGATHPYAFRRQQLIKLKDVIRSHETEILDALFADLHKSRFEAYSTEVGLCLNSLRYAIKHLNRWMKPKRVHTPIYILSSSSFIQSDPLGSVLIVGPYNYPFQLIIEPLIGAIAAGNTAIAKPSELCPHTEQLLTRLINDNFPQEYIHVVTGDHSVTQELVHLPFDHIFFTGSNRVGRIVYEAASKNLVPVTLELGGKSPTIVDATADIKKSARRIAFGKFINAGQTCIAPDYIYVHQSIKDVFLKELTTVTDTLYRHYDAFARIVNKRHFDRLIGLIDKDKVVSSDRHEEDTSLITPTILANVNWTDAVMQEEVFGPILPVLTYDHLDDLIALLKTKDKPLALYLFSTDKRTQRRVFTELSFGGGAINDTLMHFTNVHLPFGGIGHSGFGSYHGKHSFELFSRKKGFVKRNFQWDPPLVYPPYSKQKEAIIRSVLK